LVGGRKSRSFRTRPSGSTTRLACKSEVGGRRPEKFQARLRCKSWLVAPNPGWRPEDETFLHATFRVYHSTCVQIRGWRPQAGKISNSTPEQILVGGAKSGLAVRGRDFVALDLPSKSWLSVPNPDWRPQAGKKNETRVPGLPIDLGAKLGWRPEVEILSHSTFRVNHST
jgi:hypothetical protein